MAAQRAMSLLLGAAAAHTESKISPIPLLNLLTRR
jgi:hypothetical protein